MTIGDLIPADRSQRKRQLDAARGQGPAPTATATATSTDAKLPSDTSDAAIQKLVASLKTMDPVRAHRVEELRQRIGSGEYTAEADDLAAAFVSTDR